MNIPELLFYVFAGVAVLSAIGVVSVRNTVYSVLYLVLTFVATAVVWLLLETEFLALVLVLVYVGAVMTLFLFVVMMLNLREIDLRQGLVRAWPLVVIVLMTLVTMMIIATRVGDGSFVIAQGWRPFAAHYSNVADIGNVLYTTYVWPFEIAAVLLLTAIVAAIALAHRPSSGPRSLRQDASAQGNVRREDRVRLVKMQPVKKRTPE